MVKLQKGQKAFWSVFVSMVVCMFLLSDAIAAPTVLQYGDSGSYVRSAQVKLQQWKYYSGSVDGIYGSQMVKAVKLFQTRNGLASDGIIGKATANAMGLALGSSQSNSPGVNPSSGDVYLLAKAIYSEARGEPYQGQVAVGGVILNRVRNPSFPNSIAGVVYQPGAFTAVYDGQINLTPNATALQAARDAMNGWDPSSGALYYYNPAKTTNAWIYTRRVIIVIGRHRFAI